MKARWAGEGGMDPPLMEAEVAGDGTPPAGTEYA